MGTFVHYFGKYFAIIWQFLATIRTTLILFNNNKLLLCAYAGTTCHSLTLIWLYIVPIWLNLPNIKEIFWLWQNICYLALQNVKHKENLLLDALFSLIPGHNFMSWCFGFTFWADLFGVMLWKIPTYCDY